MPSLLHRSELTRPAIIMQYWLQTEKHVLLCLTPKVACSEVLDYLRWFEVGPPLACAFEPYHVPSARETCSNNVSGTYSTHSRYTRLPLGPLRPMSLGDAGNQTVHHNLLLYRDPWIRLCSGFRSKMIGLCKMDVSCFRKFYMPHISMDSNRSVLERYFDAVVHSNHLDRHFRPQAMQCLKNPKPFENILTTPIDIDNPDSLDQIGVILGHQGFTSVMGRGYSWPNRYCSTIQTSLMARISKFLSLDYHILRQEFNITFDTMQALAVAALQEHHTAYCVCIHDSSFVLMHSNSSC
mmetsp:Transcript_18297/g.58423  ORF Transcript_18297/g.58423 Transcript_18297/m.58423 type:complete len:295 (+) Transcript_18297:581-1465(+)